MGKMMQLRSEKLQEMQGMYGVSENTPAIRTMS